MAFLDNFNSGWLGQLINAGGGSDNPGWEALRQLTVGPRGGPIDRYVSGDLSGYTADEAQRMAPSQAPQIPVATPGPLSGPAPELAMPAPVQGPDSFGSYGGIQYPIFGQPEVAIPPAAQPIQYQAPQASQAPQAASPDLLQRLQAGAVNFTTGGNPIAGLINSISGLATGQRTDKTGIALQQQKQMALATFQTLRAQGVPEQQAYGMAQLIAMRPELADTLLKPSTTPEGAAVHPVYGRNAGGQGGAMDIIRQVEKEKAGGKAEGTATGKAAVDLPAVLSRGREAIRLAEQLRNHPGLQGNAITNPWWHGPTSKHLPTIGHTEANDAENLMTQLHAIAFQTTIPTMVNLGQLSDAEGAKVQVAANRIQRGLSPEALRAAIQDFEGEMRNAMDIASRKANVQAPYGGDRGGGLSGNAGGIGWKQIR